MVPDAPIPTKRPLLKVVHFAGDVAIWPGLYAAGTYGLLLWLISPGSGGGPVDWAVWEFGVLFAFLSGQAGYLLDRVKVSASRLDPADLAAMPRRAGFLRRYQRAVRIWIAIELLGAACIGWLMHPLLAAVPLGTGLGVVLYAGRAARPGSPRPKDRTLLKGPMIAAAHAALALAGALASLAPGTWKAVPIGVWIAALGSVTLLVLGDAMLCDLDDADTDRAFGTRSAPVVFGACWTWAAAWLCASLCAGWVAVSISARGGVLLGALLGLTYAVAAMLPARRDFIDARLIVIAVICVLASPL